MINGAMRHWSKVTCVTFKKRTNEKDYVRFKASEGGYVDACLESY